MLSVGLQLRHYIQRLHYWQGKLYSRVPVFISICLIVFSVTLSLVCCTGVMNQTLINDPTKVWLPQNAEVLAEANEYHKNFGKSNLEQIIITRSGHDTNVLDIDFFNRLYELNERIINNITIHKNGRTYSYNDLCLNVSVIDQSGCFQFNPLAYWGTGPGVYSPNISDIITRVNSDLYLSNNPWVEQEVVIGGRIFENKTLIKAESFQLWYFLDDSDHRRALASDWEDVLGDWELKLISNLQEFSDNNPYHMKLYINAMRSYGDEIGKAQQDDVPWLIVSIGIMTFFMFCGFAFHRDLIFKSKIFLGTMAVLFVWGSTMVAFGTAGGLQLSFASVSSYVLFLIAIIAILHAVVLLHKYDQFFDEFLSLKKWKLRGDDDVLFHQYFVKKFVETSLPSFTFVFILIESGLGLSILSDYLLYSDIVPGFYSIVIVSMLGIFMEFFLLHSFYIPCIVLDAKRITIKKDSDNLLLENTDEEEHFRYDCCCCVKMPISHMKSRRGNYKKRFSKIFVSKIWNKKKFPVAWDIFFIVVFLGLLGLGIFNMATKNAITPQPFYQQAVLPTSSYAYQYYEASNEYFADVGIPVKIVFRDLDYSDPASYDAVQDLLSRVNASGQTVINSQMDWYSSYANFLGLFHKNVTDFYGDVSGNITFFNVWVTSVTGASYALNIVTDSKTKLVSTSQIPFTGKITAPNALNEQIVAMETLREMCLSSNIPKGAYAFTEGYTSFAQFPVFIHGGLVKIAVLIAVFFVILLLMDNFTNMFYTVLCLCWSEVVFVGVYMYYGTVDITEIAVYPFICLAVILMEILGTMNWDLVDAQLNQKDNAPNNSMLIKKVFNKLGGAVLVATLSVMIGLINVAVMPQAPINVSFARMVLVLESIVLFVAFAAYPALLSISSGACNLCASKTRSHNPFLKTNGQQAFTVNESETISLIQ